MISWLLDMTFHIVTSSKRLSMLPLPAKIRFSGVLARSIWVLLLVCCHEYFVPMSSGANHESASLRFSPQLALDLLIHRSLAEIRLMSCSVSAGRPCNRA
ncbi:hypothetical protein WG66_012753 [Moniliophthora roreri]|nr:hypothetical protein WG66_012753 [Moniliophthora roreri]